MLRMLLAILPLALGATIVLAGSYVAPGSRGAVIEIKQPESQDVDKTFPSDRHKWALPVELIPKTAAEAAREQQEKDEHAANERGMTQATIWIAILTGVLGLVAGGQAALFVWQLRYMRKGMRDATIAARAASRSAVATVAQAKIARDTLTKVQRPWIFIFGVKFLETRNDVPGITPFVEYTVANYGQTPAIVMNIGASFSEEEVNPGMPLRVDDDHPILIAPILEPSKVHHNLKALIPEVFIPEDLGIVIEIATGTTHPIPRISEGKELFFRVVVEYRGAFTKGHFTSACWLYSSINNHFVQYGHEDYNYER